jgi:hypothetical protein
MAFKVMAIAFTLDVDIYFQGQSPLACFPGEKDFVMYFRCSVDCPPWQIRIYYLHATCCDKELGRGDIITHTSCTSRSIPYFHDLLQAVSSANVLS